MNSPMKLKALWSSKASCVSGLSSLGLPQADRCSAHARAARVQVDGLAEWCDLAKVVRFCVGKFGDLRPPDLLRETRLEPVPGSRGTPHKCH